MMSVRSAVNPSIQQLLLLEQNLSFGKALTLWLTQRGYCVEWLCQKGKTPNHSPAVVISDFAIFNHYQTKENLLTVLNLDPHIPVLVLLTDNSPRAKITTLEAGAVCCLLKNEVMIDLHLRIRRLIETQPILPPESKIIGKGFVLDEKKLLFISQNTTISLSFSEFTILKKLVEANGKEITLEGLCQAAAQVSSIWNNNNIRVLIYNIRKKIGKDFIVSIREVGYRLNTPFKKE